MLHTIIHTYTHVLVLLNEVKLQTFLTIFTLSISAPVWPPIRV